jgi:hypothetical protein
MHNPIIAIVVAAVAAWIFGSAWYMTLGRPYQVALGLDPDVPKDKKVPVVPMLICFVSELALAWTLYTLLGFLGERNWSDAVMTGLLLGVVFTALPILVNNLFQGHKLMLSLINGTHWIAVAVIEAVVLKVLL